MFAITPFDCKCQKSTNVSYKFVAPALIISKYIYFLFLPPESRSRLRNAMFAITSFDSKDQNLQMSSPDFCARFYRFRDIKRFNCLPSKVGHGHGV